MGACSLAGLCVFIARTEWMAFSSTNFKNKRENSNFVFFKNRRTHLSSVTLPQCGLAACSMDVFPDFYFPLYALYPRQTLPFWADGANTMMRRCSRWKVLWTLVTRSHKRYCLHYRWLQSQGVKRALIFPIFACSPLSSSAFFIFKKKEKLLFIGVC